MPPRLREPVPCLVEGSTLVAEVGVGAGLAVWRALRDLRRWAAAAPGERAALFPAGTAARRREGCRRVDAELAAALEAFAALAEAPERADEARLRDACRRVARWLEARGAVSSARAVRAAAGEVGAAEVAGMASSGGRGGR